MNPRMQNPAMVIPEAVKPIQELLKAAQRSGAPGKILEMVHLRSSQINGCSFCVDMGARTAKKGGETDERLHAVAAWRDAPYFDDAERAALALAEHATRLADRSDPVPDDVWDEAAKHFDDRALSGILLMIGVTNLFNRMNVPTKQPADPNVTF